MKTRKAIALGLWLTTLLAADLAGQGMSARITGTVRDEDGKPLAGVLVTAVNTINNATLTATSVEPDGSFRLLGLAPAIYQVSFDLAGYESYTAAGISLSVEQSITLRIKLKRGQTSAAPPEATLPPAAAKTRFFDQRGKFSCKFSVGMNRLAVGDGNKYLSSFSQRFDLIQDPFELLRWGTDLSGEIGFRVTPRLELAAEVGSVYGRIRMLDNKFFSNSTEPDVPKATYFIGFDMKTIPLALVCRYWLAGRGPCVISVFAAAQYHFARWQMNTLYGGNDREGRTTISENASRRGFGGMAGGRIEVKIDTHYSFVAELFGRWAPLRGFSGRRIYTYSPPGSTFQPEIKEGKLWFYEQYDPWLKRWVRNLEVGTRPEGDGVRNVSSATVDFSGLSLHIGLLFHI